MDLKTINGRRTILKYDIAQPVQINEPDHPPLRGGYTLGSDYGVEPTPIPSDYGDGLPF